MQSFTVTAGSALTLTVDVVGPGLDIAARGRLPSVFEWVTTGFLWAEEWKPFALASAVAKHTCATTRLAGSVYKQELAFCRPLGLLERAGAADVDGFTITYELDELWLAPGAGLTAVRIAEPAG